MTIIDILKQYEPSVFSDREIDMIEMNESQAELYPELEEHNVLDVTDIK